MGKINGIVGLYEKRGWFYYQPPTPRDGGARPNAVALRTKDLVTAIQTLEEKRAELNQWVEARRQTMDEVMPQYFACKQSDSAPTRRQREMVLRSMSTVLGNPRVDAVSPEMVEEWRRHVEVCGMNPKSGGAGLAKNGKAKRPVLSGLRSPATVKTYTIVARAFFNWAVEGRLIKESPMKRLKRQVTVVRTRRQEFLTEAEREVILAAEMEPYQRFILNFGFFAGLRDGEMLAMTPDWIWIADDWSRGTITVQEQAITYSDGTIGVWRPKTLRAMREIPLHPRLLMFLKDYGMPRPWMLRNDRVHWPLPSLSSETKQKV